MQATGESHPGVFRSICDGVSSTNALDDHSSFSFIEGFRESDCFRAVIECNSTIAKHQVPEVARLKTVRHDPETKVSSLTRWASDPPGASFILENARPRAQAPCLTTRLARATVSEGK